MRKRPYKYTVDCKITVIAFNAIQARELIQKQLSTCQYSDLDRYEDSLVEEYSKYTKLGRARRVKFYEGEK